MKLLGDRPLCPPFPQDARRFVRVDKLSALGLRKSFGNVRGNGLAFRIIHSPFFWCSWITANAWSSNSSGLIPD